MSWTFGRFRHFRWPTVAKGHRAKRKQARKAQRVARRIQR